MRHFRYDRKYNILKREIRIRADHPKVCNSVKKSYMRSPTVPMSVEKIYILW